MSKKNRQHEKKRHKTTTTTTTTTATTTTTPYHRFRFPIAQAEMEDNNPEIIFRGKNTPIIIGRREKSGRPQSHLSAANKSGGRNKKRARKKRQRKTGKEAKKEEKERN